MRRKNETVRIEDVKEWIDQPVAVILHDGSYYIGRLRQVNDKTVTLAGYKKLGKLPKSARARLDKTKISAFFPGNVPFSPWGAGGWPQPFGFSPAGMFPPAGGGAGKGGGGLLGGIGGFFGTMRKIWPGIQFGMGLVKTIMPIMGKLL
ncbi:hypothetical protein E5161_01245 [Cohnella pontilimi]|uniref:Uncharacterized protein n=1 Tax=Cohnella pontilimi TaxID=2564100 RepID=A0A4U0FKG7_9BACL|nr:hypothetical protein [Cohnella pontilimi]TJY44052.1 hypothetical protein E5161_01245 [Cohnella pontilimi]